MSVTIHLDFGDLSIDLAIDEATVQDVASLLGSASNELLRMNMALKLQEDQA